MLGGNFYCQKWIWIFLISFGVNFSEGSTAVQFPNAISEKEIECFSQEKIYHKPTNKCYKLLTTGPCPRGQWFALEKPRQGLRGTVNATIRARCVRQICRDGEYYWSDLNYCAQAKDKKLLCRDAEEELITNVFGEGECVCTRDPPRARLNGDLRERCYLLYNRGPCPPAQVFGYLRRTEVASCMPDPCYAETLYRKRNKTLRRDGILAAWENGTCYELGTRGPCPEGVIFKVDPMGKEPRCGFLLNQIFGTLTECDRDENNICQKRTRQRKRGIAEKYMKELEAILSKK